MNANTHAWELNDNTFESAHDEHKAKLGIAWFVTVLVGNDKKKREYIGYAHAYFNHARTSGWTIRDAYAKTIDFATKMLGRFYFGAYDITTRTIEERSVRVIDMLQFNERVNGGNQ